MHALTLRINDDNSIKYGAGKQHNLKMVKDLDDTGKAIFVETIQSDNKEYKTKYIFKTTPEHFILYGEDNENNSELWNYFKVNKLPE